METLLGALAFAAFILAQVLAVVAVHAGSRQPHPLDATRLAPRARAVWDGGSREWRARSGAVAALFERCTARQRRLLDDLGHDFRPGDFFYAPEGQVELMTGTTHVPGTRRAIHVDPDAARKR